MVFIRKNKNRSGSYSVQIVSKERGQYKVLKTLGSGHSKQEIEFLYQRAQQELEKIDGSISLLNEIMIDTNNTIRLNLSCS